MQVFAVDPMAINLAYIKKSLEKNLLWDTERVRLINSAVRWIENTKLWKVGKYLHEVKYLHEDMLVALAIIKKKIAFKSVRSNLF